MQDQYTYNLTFPIDGEQSHYYVERANSSKPGKINVVYETATNSLSVTTEKIEIDDKKLQHSWGNELTRIIFRVHSRDLQGELKITIK